MPTTDMVTDLLPARIASKITDTGTCWLWTGAKNKKGYGSVGIGGGTTALAHRTVYTLLVADIPGDLTLDHLCMVKACVNPEHLEPVTRAENCTRYAATLTHCKNGHAFAGSNLAVKVRPHGQQRVCKVCRAEHARAYRARQKVEVSA